MKNKFRSPLGRFIAGLLAFALVVAVVFGARQLGGTLRADVSAQGVMTPSDTSLEIASSIEKDVTITYITDAAGGELWVDELINRLDAASDRVVSRRLDATSAEAHTLAIDAGATSLTENSVVVESADRSILLAQTDLYAITYNEMYYYYTGEMVVESQKFAADRELANALLYVTRDDLPVVYTLTGHGEAAVSGMMLAAMQDVWLAVEELKLGDAQVPENAAAVIIQAPASDLTDAETDALLSYLKQGGRLLLTTNYTLEKMPNLTALTTYYGMEPDVGIIFDPKVGYCYSVEYSHYLTPSYIEHDLTAALKAAGLPAVTPASGPIVRNAVERDGLTVTELMTTSAESYTKTTSTVTTIEMEDGDAMGPFTTAMAASENDTRFVWFCSGTLFSDVDMQVSGGANALLLGDVLKWMVPIGTGVEIEAPELVTDTLNLPSGNKAVTSSVLFVPALIMLVLGLVLRRKKAV